MRVFFALLTVLVKGEPWEKCPKLCACPQPEVVHCNNVQIWDGEKYKALDYIPSDIPTETTHLELRHNNLTQIKTDTLAYLPNLVYLNLGHNNIFKLSQAAFDEQLDLKVLWLDNNLIRSLPDDIFYELEFVEQINLETNQLEFVQKFLFADLENLEHIFLQNNKIDFIHPKAFHDNTKVTRLFIYNNELTNINKDWFQNLAVLNELYIDENPYECNCVIQEFVTWSLENTLMRALFTKMAKTLPKCASPENLKDKVLYSLTDAESSLTCVAPKIPEALKNQHEKFVEKEKPLNLQCSASGVPSPEIHWVFQDGNVEVELGNSPDLYIPHMREEDFGTYKCTASNRKGEDLMYVIVKSEEPDNYGKHKENYYDDEDDELDALFDAKGDENEYLEDDDYIEENCPEDCFCDRQYADCRDADLTSVPAASEFEAKLERLDLKMNELLEMDSASFIGLTSLEEINLDHNLDLGDKIDKTAFIHLHELKFLSMTKIGMKSIGSIFTPIESLEKLILSNNYIKEIKNINFNGLSNLERLYLDGNEIENIEPESFYSLHNLQYLYLQSNKIKSMNGEWFSSFTSLIFTRINLRDNKIECSCEKIGSMIEVIGEKDWLLDAIDMDGERCPSYPYNDFIPTLETLQCSATELDDQTIERKRIDIANDDFDEMTNNDKFDFEQAQETRDEMKDGEEIPDFDQDHRMPDLPEDIREIISVSDLEDYINKELHEPEVDYEVKSPQDTPRDYKIEQYNHHFYDDAPEAANDDPVFTPEILPQTSKKTSATGTVLFIFFLFTVCVLSLTLKKWRRLLVGCLTYIIMKLKKWEAGSSNTNYSSLYNDNRFSRETLI